MYDLYLEGKSYQAIANIYNKEEILGKTNWKDSTIGKIMTNELYKGDYLHGKKTKNPTYYENVVEPIVSKEKWDNCQYQKKRNARHYERTATYLFTNKLKCSNCGHFLGGCATIKPNGKKYYYYKCKKCKTNYKEEEIKNGLLIQLYELIQKDNLINKYYTPFIKSKLDNNTEEFTKKIKDLEKQKDRIKSAYMQGIVKMDEFGNELKSIEFNIEELEKKIKEQKQVENFNFTTNDLLVLEDTKKIDELIYPDKLMENILSLTNSSREEMKRIIATYIDNIEVNKVGEQTELKYIEYRKSFLADLVNFHNEYGVPCNWSIFEDSDGSKIAMNHEGKTSKEAQEYFDKLQDTIKNDKLKLNYYEIEADYKLEDVGFIPNGDYEKVLRLIVLSDSKKYNDKTLRLGVITLDMESAILSRIGKTKEALMSYAIFRCEGVKSLSDLSNRGKHNKREKESYKTNPDIRIEDSHKNIELIKCNKRYIDRFYEITKDYRLEFNERMKNARSDRKKSFYQMINDSKSVVADEILFTSDKIFFDSLSEEELMKWANTVLDFVYEDMGYKKEQVIHATLHMDEKIPHIHLVVVPLVKKFDKRVTKERYSISKKAYIKNSIHLSELQDKYCNRINKNGFKLERGQKNTGVKNLSPKQLKQVTRIFNKDLDNTKWELNRKYKTLISKMESKTKGILNKKIVFDYDTYLELMEYLKQANEAVNKVAKSEGLYKELEKEIKYYKAFLAVNDEKDNEIKYLKKELEEVNTKYNALKSFISNLLQSLKGIFKKILSIGTDNEKDLVSEQLKEYYDNHLYSESDINDIVKDTSKEVELTNYIEGKDYDYF